MLSVSLLLFHFPILILYLQAPARAEFTERGCVLMLEREVQRCVRNAMESVRFEKVSDLTPDQLERILTQAICDSISCREFKDSISNSITLDIMRRR